MIYQGMELNELVDKVTVALTKARYSPSCIRGFKPVWRRLTHYMIKEGNTLFTAKTGMNFLENEYGITVYRSLTTRNRKCVRAVNLLTDFLLHGIIFSRTKQRQDRYHDSFREVFQGFIDKKKSDNFSPDTIESYEIYLSRFSDYLNNRGITHIGDIDEDAITGFTDTFIRYSPSVIHNTLCSLRTFLHYLFQGGFIPKNLAYSVPHDGYRKRTKIPSAYSKDDILKLLKAIDRGNPKGKRDYAIILIASRLGLRAQDICNMTFDNLKWETNTIELQQAKTKESIILPLLEDVGLAIIDYLKYGRPECDSTRTLFLRLIPPIGSLEAPTLHSIVTQHMRTAGIKIQNGKRHGPHALRHSLASALLEENIPLPVISEVLGHKSTTSTSIYLKIDVNQLRACSLEPLPFDWNKGEEVF